MAGPRSDPITFQSVTAPSNGAANALINAASKQISAGVDSLGNRISDFGDLKEEEATDAFIALSQAAGSQEERLALLANADRSFLNVGDATKAITDQQNQGFKVAADERAGQTLQLAKEQFKSSELQSAITNARADEALVDARDQFEITQELDANKFEEAKRKTGVEEKRNTLTDARLARQSDLDFEETLRKRDRSILLEEEGEANRSLQTQLTELQSRNTLKNTKKSIADNKRLIPATESLLAQLNAQDTTVTKNNSAIRAFRESTSGLLGSPELEKLIKESQLRGDALEIDQFGQTFNTPDAESGFAPTERFLLNVVNKLNKTKFTDLSQLKSEHFDVQAQTDVVRAMAKQMSEQLGGRKTEKELLPDAREILLSNDEIKKSFVAQAATVAEALKVTGVKNAAILEDLEITEKKLNVINSNVFTEIAKANIPELIRQHGDSFNADSQDRYKVIVADITKKLQVSLGFNNDTLTATDKRLLNGTIAKYVDTLTFDPGGLQIFGNFAGGWADNFRNLYGEDAGGLSNAALLNDLQVFFPNTTPVGKLIESTGTVKGGKTANKNNTRDASDEIKRAKSAIFKPDGNILSDFGNAVKGTLGKLITNELNLPNIHDTRLTVNQAIDLAQKAFGESETSQLRKQFSDKEFVTKMQEFSRNHLK